MDNTQHKSTYISQLEKLKEIIEIANSRIVSETPDDFFQNNANFFTKSFLRSSESGGTFIRITAPSF